jgi:hypothetical protein
MRTAALAGSRAAIVRSQSRASFSFPQPPAASDSPDNASLFRLLRVIASRKAS